MTIYNTASATILTNTTTGSTIPNYPYWHILGNSGGFVENAFPHQQQYIHQYYSPQPLYSPYVQPINIDHDSASIKKLCVEKNYGLLATMGDQAARISRSCFNLVEKTIMKSNNYGAIALYIRSTNNLSVKHLTKCLIKSYNDLLEKKDSSLLIQYFLTDCHSKIDMKYLLNYAVKNSMLELVEWIIGPTYHNVTIQENLLNYFQKIGVDFKKVERLILKTTDANKVFFFAKNFKQSNKRACYWRLQELEDQVLMERFVDEIDEDWIRALHSMK